MVHKSAVAQTWKNIGILEVRISWKITLSQIRCTLLLIFKGDIECSLICSIKSCMMFALSEQKFIASLWMLAFGASADQVDKIARMGKSTFLESLVRFCDAIETLYTRDYLRKPMPRDL
ncbi:hypothetical protein L3X38_037978 [Prunus dulcis]|uniref:Uncharacterized protein n=1 Tax=Prunus dulcis TaxID=3755 RepID=A0AAD4V463_PRUDU|nr:hypothetical protein L3X38_037978 [Prunus dulcis]